MVISNSLKNIGIAFLALVIVQTTIWFYFNGSLDEKSAQLEKKRETVSTLVTLEEKWSKKSQEKELKRVYDLLGAFDIYHTTKERKKRKVVTMDLTTQNADKIISFVLNRNIKFKAFNIKKIDKYNIKFSVEI